MADESARLSYSELAKMVNEIAKPLAARKLTKTLRKTAKKAVKVKAVNRGVKEVTKALRKGKKGIVILAGDVTPIDVYSHLPVMCENRSIPYCYVPSRQNLGLAVNSKRPTCTVMIQCHDDIKDEYEKCFAEVKSLPLPL
ncbi:H/ACA ribonucleoprotein complex subunit 2-like protein [Dendronephthya gigantea]|nr:H/ACA ribonucleoprotein complex subunit 2-like protein [Dendronephthya gigantea]